MDAGKYTIKNLLLSKLNRKLIILFIIIAIATSSFGIFYFYIISMSSFSNSKYIDQATLLKTVTIMIIFLTTVEAIIISFLVSRSISKPLKELYNANKEIEKGNYDIKIDIKTNDEIAELENAFNTTTSTLAKLENERKEIDSAKTEFLSIASHELRSPMTPMKAQLQMLINGYFGELNEKQKQSLEIITRNADRLDNIIVDFLEISRIEAARLNFNFVETNIEKVIRDTVQLWEAYVRGKNIEIIVVTEKLPNIETDPDRINQVLRNLINNAIKFSFENSKIEVSAKLNGDCILFSVKDYGCGLSPENQIRIFEPFYQVENANIRKLGGTGLGLTICRGIVESQKGKIWVESVLGKGSKFYFTLPIIPVREIEPIKVLFSPKGLIEKKIQDEFKKILGPLGEGEFNDLKIKNTLKKENINNYINSLEELFIISPKLV